MEHKFPRRGTEPISASSPPRRCIRSGSRRVPRRSGSASPRAESERPLETFVVAGVIGELLYVRAIDVHDVEVICVIAPTDDVSKLRGVGREIRLFYPASVKLRRYDSSWPSIAQDGHDVI